MSSRRRNSKKNLGNSISDIQRRIRRMERKPIRTRLQNRVIKGSAIAPSTITAEEVSFGTAVVTSDNPADVIDTPKEGLLIVDPTTNSASVYSEAQGDYVTIQDAAAVAIAQGKSKTYVQNDEPTGGTYSLGDLWIDTNDGNKLYAYSGSAWVLKQDGAISTAQSTADGKNKVNYSTSDPGSTANTAGDIWFKYASGIVIAQYVGAGGTTWTSTTIGNTVIANLDAGKITTGYIDVAGSVKITTSATASGTGGTTARIEINSTGFYAYDGSVATVSITNTGTAVFSGTVNATAGAFTGYVTAGTARFGANVDSTNDGIWINANNYWYDTGSFKVGDGTESMSYSSAGGLVVTGDINATGGNFTGYVTAGNMRIGSNVNSTNEGIYINASNYWYDTGDFQLGSGTSGVAFNSSTGALTIGSTATIAGSAASTVVSNAAEGATALQEGNGVAKNGSDQITTISTASGIKIGTDPTGSGARIEMNSTGFYAYNGVSATPTVQILGADGSAIFTGEVKAGTFSGNITSTATIAGGTITSTGTIGSYGSNTLTISGGKLSANSVIYLESAGVIDLTAITGLSINADTEITGTFEASGSTLFNGANNQINRDTDVGGTSTKNIRNVWIRSTLVATNASIPNSYIGDIWLQYA